MLAKEITSSRGYPKEAGSTIVSSVNEIPHYGTIPDKENNKQKSKCNNPKCCNLCMCYYICAALIALAATLIMVVIYSIVPALNFNIEIRDLEIQLYDFHRHKVDYFNGLYSTNIFNGTGGFLIKIYNTNPMDFYMHNWHIRLSTHNLFGNPEEWGYVECCTSLRNYSKENPYTWQDTFPMDQEQYFKSEEINDLDMILFITGISEELFYMGYESSWLHNFTLPIWLDGDGWAQTKSFGFDVHMALSCKMDVNTSLFLPFIPPNMSWPIINRSEFSDAIGRVPPRKYYWQRFPVLDLNCTFSMAQVQ